MEASVNYKELTTYTPGSDHNTKKLNNKVKRTAKKLKLNSLNNQSSYRRNHKWYKILLTSNKNTAYQNLWNTAKEVFREKCIALKTFQKKQER